MGTMDYQVGFWDGPGATKTFTHPVNFERLAALVAADARILDFGCGYGRVMELLYRHGHRNVEGVDISARLVLRGQQLYPHLRLRVVESLPLPYEDAAFDAVIVFAVLTCIPSNEGQMAVIREVARVLRPGGILYVSDLRLQDSADYQELYRRYAATYGMYGIFETPEGAVFRHHDMEWIATLLAPFEIVAQASLPVMTMNHHAAMGFQVFARARPPAGFTPSPR